MKKEGWVIECGAEEVDQDHRRMRMKMRRRMEKKERMKMADRKKMKERMKN